jgi:hypothetical protein
MGTKNLTQILADLRTDLKDSSTLWSDAELTRCLEKSLGDLNRFNPKQEIYEEVVDYAVADESWTSPKTTDADMIVDGQSLETMSATDTFTIAAQPDCPRVVTFLLTDADDSVTDLTVAVAGVDQDGKSVEEHFYYVNGKSQTGTKIFKTIHFITLDVIEGTQDAADTVDIGIGVYTSSWIWLANKNINHSSQTVENAAGTVTYTENTDYIMDFANGRIKAVVGGSLAANTAYLISYDKSRIIVDLSSLDGFIGVERVEYPVGNVPQTFVTPDLWGKKLFIGSGDQESQSEMSDDTHVAVQYTKTYQKPTTYAPSDYPDVLEETVLMASSAYALLIYALKQEHQAATDLASARTSLAAATTDQTALGTALTSASAAGASASAAAGIAAITTLQAAVVTALAAASTALGLVPTNSLDKATSGAEALLDTGYPKLVSVNVGGEQTAVPEGYAKLAETRVSIANARINQAIGYVQRASQDVAAILAYIQQSNAHATIQENYASEANIYANKAYQNIQTAIGYLNAAQQEKDLAEAFRQEGINRRDEVWSIWRDKRQYIGNVVQVPNRQISS